MSPRRRAPYREQNLLDDFKTYDSHVDVVSAFEWLYAHGREIKDTVAHFERFPRIRHDDRDLTPDFTVLFRDGTAIVGEIAKLGLHDNSIDKLCRQIGSYAAMTAVPDGRGGLATVTHLDVLQLLHANIGLSGAKRILVERYLDPDHEYKPTAAPCITQFSRDESVYNFQRLQNTENGRLVASERGRHLGHYLDSGLNVPIKSFYRVKADRVFCNDPVKPLYLAAHLWTKTWPTEHGGTSDDITVDPAATAQVLRTKYATGTADDVRAALNLLVAANLAQRHRGGTYTVTRRAIGKSGQRDVHGIIARRAGSATTAPVPTRRSRSTAASADQGVLF